MIEAVLFSIALALLAIGAYTDIRTREVPDWVNFSGIIIGIGFRALWGASGQSWSQLGYGVLGLIVFFALAIVMYYAGQWGGGDSKLLMAMGALLGFWFSRDNAGLGFLLWALLAGAIYGIAWSIVMAFKNRRLFFHNYAALAKTLSWARLPVLITLVLGIAFAIATNDPLFRMLLLLVALLTPALFYTAIGVKAVEKSCMYRNIPPSLLTEGDWIAKPVYYKGKYICGPKDRGISKKTIKKLQRLGIKKVRVKDGIPFVPSFLLAFILYWIFGSPLMWLV
ncbi:MAG: A24 family peptidase [Candidatus Woesearchaeota archaeon]